MLYARFIRDQRWCKLFKWIKFRVKLSCASKHTKWIPLVWIISSGFTQWSVCVHVRTYVHESISIRQVIALECLGRHWGGTWLVFKCVTGFLNVFFMSWSTCLLSAHSSLCTMYVLSDLQRLFFSSYHPCFSAHNSWIPTALLLNMFYFLTLFEEVFWIVQLSV